MIFNTVAYGGRGLNIKIVGGTTLPIGSENLTWVNTSVEIGTVYIDDSPTNPVEGDVLVTQGVQSQITINLSADDGIVAPIHPILAQQYVSGVWVDTDTSTYQSGTWILWDTSIIYFDDGDQCTDKTGGWSDAGWLYYKTTYTKIAPVIDDTIIIAYNSAANGCSIAGTAVKIDLTNISLLYARVTAMGSNPAAKICICQDKNTYYTDGSSGLHVGDVDLDVSLISGSYYVAVSVAGSTTYPSGGATVSKIWGVPT